MEKPEMRRTFLYRRTIWSATIETLKVAAIVAAILFVCYAIQLVAGAFLICTVLEPGCEPIMALFVAGFFAGIGTWVAAGLLHLLISANPDFLYATDVMPRVCEWLHVMFWLPLFLFAQAAVLSPFFD